MAELPRWLTIARAVSVEFKAFSFPVNWKLFRYSVFRVLQRHTVHIICEELCIALRSLGTYSSPNRKCVSETRVGLGSGRDFISGCFRNSVGKAYRSRYTYFSNLVARTMLPPPFVAKFFLKYKVPTSCKNARQPRFFPSSLLSDGSPIDWLATRNEGCMLENYRKTALPKPLKYEM